MKLADDEEKRLRTVNRVNLDYSRFAHLGDDEEDQLVPAQLPTESDGELVFEPTKAWQEISRSLYLPFKRSEAEAFLKTLTSTEPGAKRFLDSNITAAFTGVTAVLSSLALLTLPQRRLSQLLTPSPMLPWSRAIHSTQGEISKTASAAESKGWLVAGLGAGGSLIAAARAAKQVTFIGLDAVQAPLARALRDTLALNGIKALTGIKAPSHFESASTTEAKASDPGVRLPKISGLPSLRKRGVSDSAKRVPEVQPTVILHMGGCLESMQRNEPREIADAPELTPGGGYQALALDPEWFDEALLGRRLLPAIRNAHQHLLQPGAHVLPNAAKLFGALVEIKVVAETDLAHGLDLSAQGERCGWSHTYEVLRLAANNTDSCKGLPWKQLSDSFEVWDFNLADGATMSSLSAHDSKMLPTKLISRGTFA